MSRHTMSIPDPIWRWAVANANGVGPQTFLREQLTGLAMRWEATKATPFRPDYYWSGALKSGTQCNRCRKRIAAGDEGNFFFTEGGAKHVHCANCRTDIEDDDGLS